MKVRSSWVWKKWINDLHVRIIQRKKTKEDRIENRHADAVREMLSIPQQHAPPDLGACKLQHTAQEK